MLVVPLTLIMAGLFASTAHAEEASGTATFSCTEVTFTYTGFPNLPGNAVTQTIRVDGSVIYKGKFTFNGPSGSNTVAISVPPGHHSIDAQSQWRTNGVKGGNDIKGAGGLTCGLEPAFSIEKLQKIGGRKYTTATLIGRVGQTVEYEIIVTNTGNLALTFGELTDPHCDPGTITGGPGASPVPPHQSTIFYCDHVLTEADREAGFYENSATITGTPPPGEGEPITHTSNTVVVELPAPSNGAKFSCSGVTFTFSGFPNLPGNTVTEIIRVDGSIVYKGTFTFNGPSASNTITLHLPPGHHTIDGQAKWNTNGFKGGSDIKGVGGVTCAAEPALSIEKTQQIKGSGEPFTEAKLEAEQGATVAYRIKATNTGNVPLTLSEFVEEECTGGAPPEGLLEPGSSFTYACERLLPAPGTYTNTASYTATPPVGDGAPFVQSSNTVEVEVPETPVK